MSLVPVVKEGISALIALWFVGLGFAIIFGVPGHYIRRTKAWLLWPFALVLRSAKRWSWALLRAFVRWVIHYARDW
jgi:hypothetical protein